MATTTGFGPRFLHSTGQLHKGGPNSGVFIQVVDGGASVDLPIPGQPYSFGTLIDAQALGDLRSLRARGRRVARVTPRSAHGGDLMQLGMVGLGRMGANLTRRLMRDGHEVVVYDVNADSVRLLESEGAIGTGSLEDFVRSSRRRGRRG